MSAIVSNAWQCLSREVVSARDCTLDAVGKVVYSDDIESLTEQFHDAMGSHESSSARDEDGGAIVVAVLDLGVIGLGLNAME